MILTPAIKGQITKAINAQKGYKDSPLYNRIRFAAVGAFFEKRMPRQQAKHATRKYLASLSA